MCKTCDGGSTSNCLSCNSGRFLTSKKCLTSCPDGTWADSSSNKCTNCDDTCSTCWGAGTDKCFSCKKDSGRFLKKIYDCTKSASEILYSKELVFSSTSNSIPSEWTVSGGSRRLTNCGGAILLGGYNSFG